MLLLARKLNTHHLLRRPALINLLHTAGLLMLLWHVPVPVSSAAVIESSVLALPYDEQLLLAAATGCQFGLPATGSAGAIVEAHAATAVSTYTALSFDVQQTLAKAVMNTIGCATESVDGFRDTFVTTRAEGEPFPDQFFTRNPDKPPRAGVPKSDYGQIHTRGTLKGLYGEIYARFTAMVCLNATAGANTACQHRTTLACADLASITNYLAMHPDPEASDFLKQPGGCFQLAMEWQYQGGGDTAWTNVMPHEVWKRPIANDTSGVQAINQALVGRLTPSYKAQGIVTDNPLLTHFPPCDPAQTFLARSQAMANLQAYQNVDAASAPVSAEGPAEGFTWQLLQLPLATELLVALTFRACQYLNATASQLLLCELTPAEQQLVEAVSPRPTGKFCYMESPALDSRLLQEAAIKTGQAIVGVASETDLASAMFNLQTAALTQFPGTSVTELLLAVSGATVSIVTCEKDQVILIVPGCTLRNRRLPLLFVHMAFTLMLAIVCALHRRNPISNPKRRR